MKKQFVFCIVALFLLTGCQPSQLNPTSIPTKAIKTLSPTNTISVKSIFETYSECANAPVGENVTCKISHAYCSYKPNVKGGPTFCNDAPYPKHNFTLLRWGEDWSYLNGKCLIVTGFNHLYKGIPEIEANSISQVEICK